MADTSSKSRNVERSAEQVERHACGSEITDAVRTSTIRSLAIAERTLERQKAKQDEYGIREWDGIVWAFRQVVACFDALEADAKAAAQESAA